MKNAARIILKMVILGMFAAVSILPAAREADATPMVSVSYLETWDVANSEWDYEYYVNNQSDGGEDLYGFYLDMFGLGATLSNVLDPANWEYFSDGSTYIEWDSILLTGSEIVPGGSLTYLFSSDTRLGNLYYEALFNIEVDGIISGTSMPVSVPEPATFMLIGIGLIGLAGFRKKVRNLRINHIL